MSAPDFRSPTVVGFLEALESDAPTPGGGTGAAITGAMGAALVGMLSRLTLGRKKYEAHQELMQAIADQMADERAALLDLAEQDAAAYNAVGAAFKLPKETDDEKAARKDAIQAALKGACEVPLEVMQHCVTVIGIAKNAVTSGNKNAVSDGAAGAELCRAAMKVASYNVKINLGSIKDEAYLNEARTKMDEMMYMGTAVANEIDSYVNELWNPAPAGA
ncbi:MAG: cyclodeaminase/cyclohydrolase family protein [Planctomycetota bacterium]|nr:cyclodeaminase/cyclohydrolase family protein [Planctomycetota bacterium]